MHGRWRYGIPVVWMALIFWLSSRPTLPAVPEPWLDILLKKAGHMVEYAILTGLWAWALAVDIPDLRTRLRVAFVIAVLYAISDEVHQSGVPGRHARVLDVFVDATGAGLMARFLWTRATSSRRPGQ